MSLDLLQASNSEAKGKGNKAGIVKINVDASFNSEAQDGATGVVIRHDKGKVIAIRNKWYNSLPNVITTEALACRDGVDLMLTLNLDKRAVRRAACGGAGLVEGGGGALQEGEDGAGGGRRRRTLALGEVSGAAGWV
ncbi:hypothetical protein BRADI_4g12005v3 [Brachypodium distachyon]|uniref:RNase H type-1 domain-containing protein n=1 Tax=Brachypodium distachyon TaxID=15368 RepID=A0A2K2CM87_BRADI|nr:hypothetical protein BRADI_4g12005v3 [Brachypodium distachyon]